jgi:Tfp pilus assembly ATPase PilU
VTSMLTWLEALVAAKGSDLHLKVGSPPRMRVDGRLVALDGPSLTPEVAEGLLGELIRPDLLQQFQETNEADFAYSLDPRRRDPQERPGRRRDRPPGPVHPIALYRDGVIELDDALSVATNPHDLQVALRSQGLVA